MNTKNDEQDSREKEQEAFTAGMKARLEQARADGLSPDQIREQVAAYAREEAQQKVPQTVARARSWWSGFRNFVIVGILALGLAIGLALFVERSYAAPMCERYGGQHGLVYTGLEYPVIGSGSNTSSLGRCLFADAAGKNITVGLDKLGSNAVLVLLASFALQIDFTVPTLFILIASIGVAVSKLR